MSQQNIKKFISKCFDQMLVRQNQANNNFYNNLIDFQQPDTHIQEIKQIQQVEQFRQHIQQPNQQSQQHQQQQQTLSVLPILTKQQIFINSNAHLNQLSLYSNSTQLNKNQNQKQNKTNPRNNKFIRRTKNIISSFKQSDKNISQQKSIHQQTKQLQLFKIKLKQKNIQKLQLQQKLKKLNNQLEIQKKSIFSICNSSFDSANFIENPQNMSPKLGAEKLKQSLFTNKQIHNYKSDSTFKSKNKYLKNYEQAYSPIKHQQARKLVSKFHQEKLKKHQKYLSDLRKKQQKQLQILRKLQDQKRKDKLIQRSRIIAYHDTPNSKKSQSTPKKLLPSVKQTQMTPKNRSKSFFNSRKIISFNSTKQKKEEQIQKIVQIAKQNQNELVQIQREQQNDGLKQLQIQIGSVIPHQKNKQNAFNKTQTLYTQQFQPVTEEGKQFAQLLKNAKEQVDFQQSSQNIQPIYQSLMNSKNNQQNNQFVQVN